MTNETTGDSALAGATFTDIKNGTAEDWQAIVSHAMPFMQALPERIRTHLRLLDGDFGGFPVDRLTHCLQTASLAEKAGKSDQYILCALIHDIGDTIGSFNHQEIAASILHPFVTEDLHWMVSHHAEFQGQYFFDYIGLDKATKDQYKDSPYFDMTQEFVAEYDSPAFDPARPTPPLEHFVPLMDELMSAPLNSIYKDVHG